MNSERETTAFLSCLPHTAKNSALSCSSDLNPPWYSGFGVTLYAQSSWEIVKPSFPTVSSRLYRASTADYLL